MKLRIVRDREGAILAAAEVPEGLSGITSSAEPVLEEGHQVEEVEVSHLELLNLEGFYRSGGK